MSFSSLNPAFARTLAARGYHTPTSVQEAVLAVEDHNRDLLVSAETGSGKTIAYGLAAANNLLGDRATFPRASQPLCLIIAPTRELALQVQQELTWLFAETRVQIVSCIGGMDARREQRLLSNGCHIVVGTPGRLRDHLERGQLDPSSLSVVVLDEADEMLDLGFQEDLQFILDSVPENRRTLLFSATIAKEIADLARQYQKNAIRIDTVAHNQPHADIEYRALRIAPNEIEHGVVNVLRYFGSRASLVFCATRDGVRHLCASLLERGFSVVALSGELSQTERNNALQSIREGRASVCVATDVAARGLDLPDLGLVIHADLPTNKEALLHRSGRTGRAGKKGVCVLLVPYTKRRRAEQLLTRVNAKWGEPPSAEEVRAKDRERMLTDPILIEPPTEEEQNLARMVTVGRTPETIAAYLVRLYRSRLPEPEELFKSSEDNYRNRREDDRRDGTRPRTERADYERSPATPSDASWFKVNIGRYHNTDLKWLIPLICRLGHITKRDIGGIKILEKETRFEITKEVATRFLAATQKSEDSDTVISPIAAGETPPRSYQPRSPRGEGGPREGSSRSEGSGSYQPRTARPEGSGRPEGAARRSYGDDSREGKRTMPGRTSMPGRSSSGRSGRTSGPRGRN